MRIKELTIILILALFGLASCKQHGSTDNWEKFFQENYVNGTFVLKNMNTNEPLIYNKERSNEEFVPASTFKILNSMIALQESSIANINDTIKWDGINRSFDLWNKDQTMKSALPISCVWFYQELARRTGKEKMQEWIDKTNYGNKKIENKIDRFWLDGPLEISAVEQTKFLAKLIKNELPLKKENMLNVKEILKLEDDKNMKFYGKTGLATFVNGKSLGWFVGFIEKNGNYYSFALNIDIDDDSELARRIDIVKDSFRVLNIM